MKTCSICNNNFTGQGIKYCSNKCAYMAIDIKSKERKKRKYFCNCGYRLLWVSTMTMWGFIIGVCFGFGITFILK